MKHLLLFLALYPSQTLLAKIWQVGPTRSYTLPSAVSSLVADGDTVEIDAGLYTGNVAKWFANNLVLRCPGPGYAHLEANGNHAEGKAIWVIKGANCTVEGIEFSGCKVPDHNGAGIRQEGKNLTLRNCYFHHNEMGILTSNDGLSDYLFESCEFSHNGYGDGYSHNIYVGAVNSLTMRFCYSHDAHIGHLVKSRARFNDLYYNRFTGENGDGSYEVDLPNGGQAVLIGNLIEQSPQSQNGGIVSFGLENQNHPEQHLVLSHNTVVNDRFDGRFVQFSNATAFVKLVNNLFLGPGTLLQGTAATLDTTHNLRLDNVASALLSSPGTFDYQPLPGAPGVDAGIAPGFFNNRSLSADYAYLHPLSHIARWPSGAATDVGAYELLTVPYRRLENELPDNFCLIFPNPATASGPLGIWMRQPMSARTRATVLRSDGTLMQQLLLESGQQEIALSPLSPGYYRLLVEGWGQKTFLVVR